MKNVYRLIASFVLTATAISATAGQVTITNTFSSGTPAVASQVNTNFSDVKTAVDDNDARIKVLENTIAALQNTISTMQAQLTTIKNSQVMALDPYLTVDTVSDSRGPLVQLKGINLQLVNGSGYTWAANGLGNLIIGYDVARNDTTYFCSNANYTTQTTCQNAGATWAVSLKGGSHYLVVGDQNNYSSYAGIVNGYRNTANNYYSSVTGGFYNTASGSYSSVSGGTNNTASNFESSVSGGSYNTASGAGSSVSGGQHNTASGGSSSVSGGGTNTASGGTSHVSGGYLNTASGGVSSVSGGSTRSATGSYNWVAGTLLESQ